MGSGSSAEVGGVRVFKVSPGSPAEEAGLEVYFDFIIEVNGAKMTDFEKQKAFSEKLKESENSICKMLVYNTRAHSNREVVIMPRKWAGNGLLGATVRYDVVDPAENHGIRVLEVFPNSPAAHAGLIPYQDFMLGTASSCFHDIDELVESVSGINKQVEIYVYNADSETIREVTLSPNKDWEGEGCIGCDIGTGLLHRIPAPRRPPGGSAIRPAAPPVQAVPSIPPAPGQPQAVYPPGVNPQVPQAPPAYTPGVPPAYSVAPQAFPAPMAQAQGVPMPQAAPGWPQPQAGVPGMPAVSQVPSSVPAGMPAIPTAGGVWNPAAMASYPAMATSPVAATAQMPVAGSPFGQVAEASPVGAAIQPPQLPIPGAPYAGTYPMGATAMAPAVGGSPYAGAASTYPAAAGGSPYGQVAGSYPAGMPGMAQGLPVAAGSPFGQVPSETQPPPSQPQYQHYEMPPTAMSAESSPSGVAAAMTPPPANMPQAPPSTPIDGPAPWDIPSADPAAIAAAMERAGAAGSPAVGSPAALVTAAGTALL